VRRALRGACRKEPRRIVLLPVGGQEFGKYLLLDRIAVGGMSEIYRARMTAAAGVTKQVVIKKILPSFAGNPAFVSMFINEARIAAGLSHGNISQVFDFGEVDGEYYLALEWVHGQPLSKVMRRARDKELTALPIPLALLVATEMLQGLEYAHNRLDESGRPLNIVHRDVSPQNVLLGYEGQIKLVDFGIARARLASSGETEATAAQGKYLYFSPEQALGRELDARADIFAAGVVLYQLLCGRLPWEGERLEVLQRIARGDFPPPRSINPGLSPELERILLTAMAVEREQRYPSAQAFGEALETYLHTAVPGFPVSALAHFMGYLFESELVTEGRPVRLPPDFLAQLEQWGKGLPAEPPRLRAPSRSLPAPALPPPPESPEPARRRWSPASWVLFGAPVAAALLAAAFIVTGEEDKTFSVELTSTPQGASVWVDGLILMDHTPALIPLSADREHLIEVHAIGMESWSQRVQADEGATLAVRANLRPANPRLARQTQTGASALPPGSQVPNEGTFPLPSFELRPSQHAFLVPPSSAARLRLDPSRTYSLRTEGHLTQGKGAGPSADTVVYYLEGGAALPARKSFGLLGAQELRVSNAFALYLFVPETSAQAAPSGSLQVEVRETASGTGATVMVDARQHALTPRPGESYTLRGLDPASTYEVRLRDTARPARTRGIQGEAVGRVLVLQDGGCGAEEGGPWKPGHVRVVETGHATRFTGMSWLRFTFPDEDLEDNAGAISVEVVPVAGPRPQGC